MVKRGWVLTIVVVAWLGCKSNTPPRGAALAKKYLNARSITSRDFAQLTADVEKALGPVKIKSADVWEWAQVDGDQCWHFVVDREHVAGEAYNAEARNPEAFAKCKGIADAR